jgi:ketosteroid isomerase-like protein
LTTEYEGYESSLRADAIELAGETMLVPLQRRFGMRHVGFRVAPVILMASVASVIGLAARGGADEGPEKAIRGVLERQVDDWNRGDLDAFLTGYWKSPALVFQSGADRSEGWEAIRDRYRKRYQTEGRAMGRLEFAGIEVIPLGAESAFARGRWQLTMSNGSRPAGLFTLIFRKFPEGWKIVHDHTSGG